MEAIGETEKKFQPSDQEKQKYRMRAAAFLATVSGMAAFVGFSRTIATARKQDQQLYEQATVETVNLIESGTRLATRALAWGTFYAVLGTGTFFYGIWKLSGAKNMDEFRHKMGSVLPKISKDTQTSRTEFEGLNDLMKYLSTHKKTE
ncbi:transmembrane protein 242 [Sitodiplosis mosellana]|uniref:transmembrane protein 242 n=1 Tax=Sitodiplosis mosellana TaxID=263140 RepID=UPI002443B691|nr:transmembrane protein 242 [Sitodiplosis mosellana]